MYATMYYMVAAVGGVALLFAIGLYRLHDEIELFAGISLFAWVVIALGSGNLAIVENGEIHTFVSFPVQLFAAGLALVSLFAIYGALTGNWPPEQGQDREGPI